MAEAAHTRRYHLDLLRVLAIAAVVLMHTAGRCGGGDDNARSYVWQVCGIFGSATRWAVPVFVMISGSLFLDAGKRLSLGDVFGKYIRRLALAYLFWAPIYALFLCLTGTQYSTGDYTGSGGLLTLLRDVLYGTLAGGDFHLWYLFMLSGVYLFTPLMKVFVDNADEKTRAYALLVLFLASVAMPLVDHLVGPGTLFDKDVFNLRLGLSASAYLFYFLLGWYLDNHDIGPRGHTALYVVGGLCCVFTIVAVGLESWGAGVASEYWRKNPRPNVMVMAASLFVFVRARYGAWRPGNRWSAIIGELSRRSFGIYLSHLLFVRALASVVRIQAGPLSPLLNMAVVFVGAFAASYALTGLLMRQKVIPFAV